MASNSVETGGKTSQMPRSTQGKQTEHFFGCSCHLLAPVRLAAVVVASAVRLDVVCVVTAAVRVDVVYGAVVVAIVGSGRLPSTIVFDKKTQTELILGDKFVGSVITTDAMGSNQTKRNEEQLFRGFRQISTFLSQTSSGGGAATKTCLATIRTTSCFFQILFIVTKQF